MKRIYLSVAWPILVLLGVLAFAQIRSGTMGANVQTYRLKIRGYDPKDLLRGRYLQYVVDWNFDSDAENFPDAGCLCLRKDPQDIYPRAHFLNCADTSTASCDSWASRSSVSRLNRFYLPEDDAPVVEAIFFQSDRLFEIEVNVTASGEIAASSLLIDGSSWETAVAAERAKSPRND